MTDQTENKVSPDIANQAMEDVAKMVLMKYVSEQPDQKLEFSIDELLPFLQKRMSFEMKPGGHVTFQVMDNPQVTQ